MNAIAALLLMASPGDWGASIRGYEASAPLAAAARPTAVRATIQSRRALPQRPSVSRGTPGRPVFTPVGRPAAALNRGLFYDQTAYRDGYNIRKAINAAGRGRSAGDTTFRRYYAPRGVPNGIPD